MELTQVRAPLWEPLYLGSMWDPLFMETPYIVMNKVPT